MSWILTSSSGFLPNELDIDLLQLREVEGGERGGMPLQSWATPTLQYKCKSNNIMKDCSMKQRCIPYTVLPGRYN
jgi:hypothetical protein